MLSPGKRHLKVPRDKKLLPLRRALLELARTDPAVRQALLELCRQDCLFFINLFVFQYNPNAIGGASLEEGPFVTWPYQDDAVSWILDHIERRRDGLIEKSREMGASWLNLIVKDWLSLFHRRKNFLLLSHTEAAVDKAGDPNCLFEKLVFIHEHLPDWMLRSVDRKKLQLTYPATGSIITGASSTERAGVGGRSTAIFLDEFSKQRDDTEILGQTADTSSCRIFNGTHYGTGTEFYRLSRRPDLDKYVMHWSMHPDKRRGLYRWSEDLKRVEVLDRDYPFPPDYHFVLDGSPTGGPFPGLRSPWYDAECLRRASRRDVAMHLDIDPQGSQSQYFEPAVIRQLIAEWARDPDWQGDVDYDRDTGRPVGLVEAPGGPLKLWCRLRGGRPEKGRYCVGGDISAGTGATPSVLVGGNARLGEQAFEYATPFMDPKEFARVAVALCWLFCDEMPDGAQEPARLIWEMQGPGLNFAKAVLDLGFRNIYYRTAEEPHTLQAKVSDRPGWVPNNETIPVLLGDYRGALYAREWVVRSEAQLRECLDFEYTDRGDIRHAQRDSRNDPSGARVNHGDRVVGGALCLKMARAHGKIQRTEDEPEQDGPLSLAWRRRQAEARQGQSRWG